MTTRKNTRPDADVNPVDVQPVPYLCGGIFLNLLFSARANDVKAVPMASALLSVVKGKDVVVTKGKSFDKDVSAYKNCSGNGGSSIPFGDADVISLFKARLKEKNSDIFLKMSEFIGKFISKDEEKQKWLVGCLLDIVSQDAGIKEDDKFHMMSPDKLSPDFISKYELIRMTDFELTSFLLCVLAYIMIYRDENTKGGKTIDEWFKKRGANNEKELSNSDLGSDFIGKIHVHTMKSPPNIKFDEYLTRAKERYSIVKTMLYLKNPREFEEFYVRNDIECLDNSGKRYELAMTDISSFPSRFVIIEGAGGIGKSMLLRHMMLNAVSSFGQTGKLPIFVPLREYTLKTDNLHDFVFKKLSDLCDEINVYAFDEMLTAGSVILLFDGLDEVGTGVIDKFHNDLGTFTDRYFKNTFIISSRPFSTFAAFERFTVLKLMPFDKKKAIELIGKLEFMPDTPYMKENFLRELDTRLYDSHRAFVENPMLLTLMLLTYSKFAEIPEKIHTFYWQAYLTLAQTHDEAKGAFKREFASEATVRLGVFDFADYFSEFCFRTYAERKFSLTEIEFDSYFGVLKQHDKHKGRVRAEDFRHDMIVNLCLMYREDDKYNFIHRSFQEFFCARCLSKQMDEDLYALTDYAFFGTNLVNRALGGEMGFAMLYDMIPEKVERYIFLPFLRKIFTEHDGGSNSDIMAFANQRGDERSYWMFLGKIYKSNVISRDKGNTSQYTFAMPNPQSPPPYKVMIEVKRIDIGRKPNTKKQDSSLMIFGLSVGNILKKPAEYSDLIRYMESDDCPLKLEYKAVREYWGRLESEVKRVRSNPLDRLK